MAGAGIMFLIGWAILAMLACAVSAVVYRKAGFDDWGNYAALAPLIVPLMLWILSSTLSVEGMIAMISMALLPVSLLATLILLAFREWPALKNEEQIQ